MQFFVAGATGVLGRRVVPQLVGAGHQVVAVARDEVKAGRLRSQGAQPVTVDLFDPAAVARAAVGAEAVLNLATAIPPTSRMLRRSAWRETDRLRTEAARNLVDAAIATGAGRYVQEALGFVYPDRGAAWIDEETPLEAPPNAASVLEAEAQARRFDEQGGVGVTLRFGLFYSPDSRHTRDLLDLARRGWLAIPGDPDGYRPWVHVDDAASAVVAALQAPGGVFNVVEDEPVTNAEHAAVLGTLVGRRVRQPPAWLGFGPLAAQARSQRVSNRRLRASTGWRPSFPSRREGLRHVVGGLERNRA